MTTRGPTEAIRSRGRQLSARFRERVRELSTWLRERGRELSTRLRDRPVSDHLRDPDPGHVAVALSVLAAVLAYLVSTTVFPYHSLNHDEGVYLQQAAILLEGQLFLWPPVEDVFRPWFFVEDGSRLYPKYAPVPAAMFALGELLGGYRLALAGIAGGTVGLAYRTVAEAFDGRTGVVAATLLLASPLFLVNAGVFLPYLPTTFLNLAFAAAYLHSDRTGSRRSGALAGLSVGLAFFARPYTAVLFATPFVAHALWTLRSGGRSTLVRQATTASLGLLGVAAALAYNAVVTGDPLLFPYEAFAPLDGLGFGRRELLGRSIQYTPGLALRANATVLWLFATRWVAAGALGTILAAGGLVLALRRGLDARQWTVAGLAVTVPLGNVYFWGNLNVLGTLGERGDGLVDFLGPYYHLDLLVPTATFGAVAVLAVVDAVRERIEGDDLRALAAAPRSRFDARVAGATVAVLLGGLLVGAAVLGAVAGPMATNYDVTRTYDAAYEPFEEQDLDGALVFVPRTYGDWQNHPFQYLRNDPGFDGETVYALRDRQFEVVDAFPERTYYRFVYRGQWAPVAGQRVAPGLDRVDVVAGETVRQDVALGVPTGAERVSIRLSSANESTRAFVDVDSTPGGDDHETVALRLDANATSATLTRPEGPLETTGQSDVARVAVDDRDTVVVRALVDFGTGAGFTYRIELPVERTDDGVRALSSYDEVCRVANQCDGEAAYVPGEHLPGVSVETSLDAAETTHARTR